MVDKVKRLEVCGNIAAGKTTFAKAYGMQYGQPVLFEDFSSICFLDDFYNNPSNYAFETEISFTLLHYYQLKKIGQGFAVADFSLIDDYAFALTTLTPKEFDIYQRMFDYIIESIGYPQKVVFLQAKTETLISRIQERGRGNETEIDSEYLETLAGNIQLAIAEKFLDTQIITLDTDIYRYDCYERAFFDELLK